MTTYRFRKPCCCAAVQVLICNIISQEDLPVRRRASPPQAAPYPHPGGGPTAPRRPNAQPGCVLRTPQEGQRRTAALPLSEVEACHGECCYTLFVFSEFSHACQQRPLTGLTDMRRVNRPTPFNLRLI